MKADYSYFFTETAETDYLDIVRYIADELQNPEAADSFTDALEEALFELCRLPKAGHIVENRYLKRKDVRRILIKHYVAYYLIDDEQKRIVVLRIVYGKQNQEKIFPVLNR